MTGTVGQRRPITCKDDPGFEARSLRHGFSGLH